MALVRHNATNLQRGAARLFFLHCRPAYRRLRAEPPAAAIWPQVRTHNHTVPALTPCKGPSSIRVGAKSSFCSLVRTQ